MDEQQLKKIESGTGFIAALDQSGGSTPRALAAYGISESSYNGEDQMFDMVHAMRTRIVTSPAFDGDRVLGAILFENTMDRQFSGQDAGNYLWQKKRVVPFIKVDKGLAEEADGVQVMKPLRGLDTLLSRAMAKGMFGTKMRSLIHRANADGIRDVVDQQFAVARKILAAGLMPIVEPEVNIEAPDKPRAEELLRDHIRRQLDGLDEGQRVMLKLTLPSVDDFYSEFTEHPAVLRVVALSGGYPQAQSNELLARNHGVIASFSRALTEGLSASQSDEEFNAALDRSIAAICTASQS